MNTRSSYTTLSAAIASLIALSSPAAARPPASVTVAQEARETLKEMKMIANTVAEEASRLDASSRQFSPEAQLGPLDALKLDINTMGKDIAELQAARDSLQPWEQQAIDKVLPLLKEAAANTDSAIAYFNENRQYLWSPQYRAYTDKVSSDAGQIGRTLKDYLKYESVREQEQRSQTALGAGGN